VTVDTTAHARDVLAATTYVVLATADADGHPWATPVWFAADGLDRILWVSATESRHSRLIEERPEVALTVFDSTVLSGEAAAFYATAVARPVPDDLLDGALAVYNARGAQQGLDPFTRERLTGDARLRLYEAVVVDAWVLDQDAPVDRRTPVPRRD